MFKKKEKPKRDHTGKSLAQYGLFEIPTDFDTGLGSVDDEDDGGDSDLEAELAALAGGAGPTRPKRRGHQKLVSPGEIDVMAAESLRDIPSDDDVSVDENDPELLGELTELTGGEVEEESLQSQPHQQEHHYTPSNVLETLNQRLENYETAEANAKQFGETSKARRYGRAIKTLKGLISQAQKGSEVNLNDDTVPPDIHVSDKKPTSQSPGDLIPKPSRPAPSVPIQESAAREPFPEPGLPEMPQSVQDNVEEKKKDIDKELLDMLLERQKEYKISALKAKKSGDAARAVKFIKISKQFEIVIEAVKGGQPVDLSQMPGPPEEASSGIEVNETQKAPPQEITVPEDTADLPEPTLITASSVLEALEQRLAVYKEHEAKAKEEGNSSKARRYGRIVKQFESAIKSHKAGKPVAYDELPNPPGYAPIPVEGTVPTPQPSKSTPTPKPDPEDTSRQPSGSPLNSISKESPKSSSNSRISGNHVSTTHADKQVLILLAKQKQFKQAAITAKKQGEINEAKEFLRQAKGFDKLIEAARAGLPVDWSSIPVSPEAKSQLDNEYDIVMQEGIGEGTNEDLDLLARLEIQLQKQLKMCLTTRDHNKALGDVAGTNRFERLALNVTKDLDVVRIARRTGKVPTFHYEMKEFSIVKSFTDILENTMELTIHRGISYLSGDPKSIDTYVKFDFPFPQDTPYSGKTATIRDTNNPEYGRTFVIPIQRSSRNCQRVFKRQAIKFEVYSKGGFFRGDTLIGTASVKIQPLETKCEIHDSFDLMDGRKKVGGKLEIQVRLRTPLLTQQVEQVQEKWLVIDQ